MVKFSIVHSLIDTYIEELNELLKHSLHSFCLCQKDCARITKKNRKNYIKAEKRHDELLYYLAMENEAENLFVEYMQLSGIIQSIGALLELQCGQLIEDQILGCTEKELCNNGKAELYNYWSLYNVLKHGKEGRSGKELQKNAPQFFEESEIYSIVNYHYNFPVLNINRRDITKFVELIIGFWKNVQNKLK